MLVSLYKNFSIDWDTNVTKLKAEDFPTFKDLYDLILEEFKENQNCTITNINTIVRHSNKK